MKVLVTGALGQLGGEVMRELAMRGHDAVGIDVNPGEIECSALHDCRIPVQQADICDAARINDLVAASRPDAVIHCAAWTDVDGAEDPQNEAAVWRINVDGSRNLAQAAQTINAKMVYVSSDYVFGGQGEGPLKPDDACFPCNAYGKSKREGELAVMQELERHFIVRTSWLFGPCGKNFVDAVVKAGATRDEVRVVNDQVGTPTYAPDLARLLVDMVETDEYGIYHATNAEASPHAYISWHDFACEIFQQAGCTARLVPVSTEEYGMAKAARPHNSRLDKSALAAAGFESLPRWDDALRRYLDAARGNDAAAQTSTQHLAQAPAPHSKTIEVSET